MIKDCDARYLKVNKAWCEFYGIPEEVALGKTVIETSERLEQEEQDIFAADQLALKNPDQLQESERERITSNGEKRITHDFRSAIRDEQGIVMGLVGVSMDITDRIRAEADLAKKELLLRTVLDSIPSRVVVRDSEGRRVLANKAQAQVMGTSTEESPGFVP